MSDDSPIILVDASGEAALGTTPDAQRRRRARLVSASSAREDLAKTRRFLSEGGPRHLGEMVAKRVRRVAADRRSLD